MWCTTTRKLSQRPNSPLPAAGALVQPVDTVRDLGVHIDSDLGASTHVRRTVSRCFAALRQLQHLHRFVTDDCFRSLVVSLVHSRLDYGNFLLVALPAYQQRHLASVLNAAARLVYRLRHYDHITDALATLHWLHLPEGCQFQGGRHGVSHASRSCSTVPESADSCCRPAGASPTTVIVITVTSRSIFPSVYRWAALVSCSCIHSFNSLPLDI